MAGGRKTPKWERNRVTGSGDGGKSEGCRGERQGCKEETRDAGGEPGMGGGGGGRAAEWRAAAFGSRLCQEPITAMVRNQPQPWPCVSGSVGECGRSQGEMKEVINVPGAGVWGGTP